MLSTKLALNPDRGPPGHNVARLTGSILKTCVSPSSPAILLVNQLSGDHCPGLPVRLPASCCLPARSVYRARQADLQCRSSLHRKGYGAPHVSRDGSWSGPAASCSSRQTHSVIRVAGPELTFRWSALDRRLQATAHLCQSGNSLERELDRVKLNRTEQDSVKITAGWMTSC